LIVVSTALRAEPDVKNFADKTAKVVQEHLDLAKETQGKLQ